MQSNGESQPNGNGKNTIQIFLKKECRVKITTHSRKTNTMKDDKLNSVDEQTPNEDE